MLLSVSAREAKRLGVQPTYSSFMMIMDVGERRKILDGTLCICYGGQRQHKRKTCVRKTSGQLCTLEIMDLGYKGFIHS